ncbi:MAG: DUF58 domain-containing protein [Pseudomonadota bacterium]
MSSSVDSTLSSPSAQRGARGRLAQRFDRWALARHTPGSSTRLTHRNVYILPTRVGLFFAVLLLVLLVLSINYQLNLGYLLTFLLAGSAMMAMHVTHNNLRGLQLAARAPEGLLHQGQSARLGVLLQGGTRDRWGLALRPAGSPPSPQPVTPARRRAKAAATPYPWTYTDCGKEAEALVTLSWTPPHRGLLPWPLLTVESQYPLGVWTAWSRWRPQGELLVLPAVEHPAPPLPAARPTPGSGPAVARGGSETEGVRPWRPGDALRQVLWKKFARSDELVSRDTAQPQARAELWLDFAALPASLDTEARLSRLCAWVLAADRAGMPYGLRLGTQQLAPSTGAAHRAACLRLLALHPGPLRLRATQASAQTGAAA